MYDFPNSPTTGQTTTTPSGSFRWDGTKWAPVGAGGYLPLTGGTLTGNLTLSYSGYPSVILNSPASGSVRAVYGQTGGLPRWGVNVANSNPETGSNVGSNFSIDRYNDAGSYVDSPLAISRATGVTTLSANLSIACASAALGLSKPVSGTSNGIYGQTGGVTRWSVAVGDSTPESGSNAGSNFVLNRHNDAGAFIDSPFVINRPDGMVTMTDGAIIGLQGVRYSTYSTHFHAFNWNGSAIVAWVDNTNVGTIAVTSDYRTKKDVQSLPGTWDIVKRLRPVRYTQAAFKIFEADDKERWGFVAHELQDVLIEDAATGFKDGEEIQSPNSWTIVAALTRALQEAITRIEALESKV